MTVLYTIFIQPIEMLLTIVYGLAMHYTHMSIGLSIIALSIIVNLLALPLYKKEDKFRFVSLIPQVLIYIAVYHFISELASLKTQSFLMIPNLGESDSLLVLGSISVNVLPIVMTLINALFSVIYTRKRPLKIKILLYGIVILLLILLYDSPAGLVIYWMINSFFSLFKEIILYVFEKKLTPVISDNTLQVNITQDGLNFIIGVVFLLLLVGCIIPSNLIRLSVAEFVDTNSMSNPLIYILYACFLALGTFIVWFGMYYILASNKNKTIISELIAMLCAISVAEYLFFGNNLGLISPDLKYDRDIVFDAKAKIFNLAILFAIAVCIHIVYRRDQSIIRIMLFTGAVSMALLTIFNVYSINKKYNEIKTYVNETNESTDDDERFKLSRNGKNVVFIMLDRAMGTQFPYIINEKPELKDKFSGFTYYKNTVSYGNCTNFGVPSIYGGYEYTPWAFNEREDMLIPDQHDEAIKVLPVLFSENGYDVTICDPPYAGYEWIPNLSVYDDYPKINAFNTEGKFDEEYDEILGRKDYRMKRNFFCYSIMRISPLALWGMLYDGGMYNEPLSMLVQVTYGTSKSYGYNAAFLSCFSVLQRLGELTDITDDSSNTLLMLQNGSTHSQTMLQEPDYTIALNVDNTEYDSDMETRYTLDGVTMAMKDDIQITHYDANIASIIEIGKWLDMLKDEGVYDNTRIVIVADHGCSLNQFGLITDEGEDIEAYLPLLLMKDFNATNYKESDEFMTNADGVSFMVKDIIDSPVNPFTGNPLDGHEKYEAPIRITTSIDYDIDTNNGYRFTPATWYTVSDDPYIIDNWKSIGEY